MQLSSSPSLTKGRPIAVPSFACFLPPPGSTREGEGDLSLDQYEKCQLPSLTSKEAGKEFPVQLYVHTENSLCNSDFGESCKFRGLRHWDKPPLLLYFHSRHRLPPPCFFFFFWTYSPKRWRLVLIKRAKGKEPGNVCLRNKIKGCPCQKLASAGEQQKQGK